MSVFLRVAPYPCRCRCLRSWRVWGGGREEKKKRRRDFHSIGFCFEDACCVSSVKRLASIRNPSVHLHELTSSFNLGFYHICREHSPLLYSPLLLLHLLLLLPTYLRSFVFRLVDLRLLVRLGSIHRWEEEEERLLSFFFSSTSVAMKNVSSFVSSSIVFLHVTGHSRCVRSSSSSASLFAPSSG